MSHRDLSAITSNACEPSAKEHNILPTAEWQPKTAGHYGLPHEQLAEHPVVVANQTKSTGRALRWATRASVTSALQKDQYMNALTKWNPFRKSNGGGEWGSLSNWSPIREMEQMQSRMERLFANWPAWPELQETMTTTEWSPLVDITEDEKEYLVKAEIPEVKKEDLKVKVEDGTLSITGERQSENEEKGKKFHRIERSYGSFERRFRLPEDADSAKVSSEFKDGVLKVHLPKSPNASPKAIEVKIQ